MSETEGNATVLDSSSSSVKSLSVTNVPEEVGRNSTQVITFGIFKNLEQNFPDKF